MYQQSPHLSFRSLSGGDFFFDFLLFFKYFIIRYKCPTLKKNVHSLAIVALIVVSDVVAVSRDHRSPVSQRSSFFDTHRSCHGLVGTLVTPLKRVTVSPKRSQKKRLIIETERRNSRHADTTTAQLLRLLIKQKAASD